MLPVKTIAPYTMAGLFGVSRKYDTHTGLDLYCNPQTLVKCVSEGVVKEVIDFTGEKVGSPWWHDTQAVVIEIPNGTTMVYGELLPAVEPQQKVTVGQTLGWVKQVLMRDKGVNPPCMLHFELWESDYQSNYLWLLNQPAPKGLINPLKLFNYWVLKSPYGYHIETHDGIHWRYFASAIDCKAFCMSRSDEYNESYVYVKTDDQIREYTACTGKYYGLKR